LKGIITYANPDFERASDFSLKELVGKPHNMIRHPDMPAEAFADLWATLTAGETWRGLVKNARKDGGFYWVVANVSPNYENGQLVGYISVRTKATRAEIMEHENVYRLFKQGQQGNLIIKRGKAVDNSLFNRLNFFNDYSIKKCIITIIAILVLSMIATAGLGLFSFNESTFGIMASIMGSMCHNFRLKCRTY
jgi:methyl-accepting chemotaxis protein